MKLNISKLKPRSKIHIAGIGACVVITVLAYAIGIHPQVASAMRHTVHTIKIAEQNEGNLSLRKAMRELNTQLESSSKELSKVPFTLQPASRLNQQLATITELASQSSVGLHRIKPDVVVHAELYDVTPIRIAGSGTYRTCAVFVKRLHEQCPDLGVVGMNLISRNHSTIPHIEFDLQLSWYTAKSTPQTDQE